MKVKKIDRAMARQLGEEAEKALQKVFASYGLEVKRGNSRFSASQVTMKFECAVPGLKSADNELHSNMLGFDRDIVGMMFCKGRSTYTIVELHLRKPKYPIIAVTERGARYKFPIGQVAALLASKGVKCVRNSQSNW